MADLLTAAASHERAVTGATHDDGDYAWRQWKQWCESVGLELIEQNLLLGAFAVALREGQFSHDCSKPLVEGTVRGALSHVVQAFREM